MDSDAKRQFLRRWANIAGGVETPRALTDRELDAVAAGWVAKPLYGVIPVPIRRHPVIPVTPPAIQPLYGVRVDPISLNSATQ
ncbi:conserved protein of unknown function [Rhodovastum atsumiense]|uniref:Uncharacterized protein n=1 Tax=Rhodovastum atsumiense TaxID=504468 RepID=A0A5M6IX64_9PROT|nr:hypothetical protein [Rhodovastum atsumiense]KAA5612924.1 hypothetical protein F1189_07765 [Rhodovastum atsumiense]CAH2600992.1 conserved protein of unknown function [Rhodovastum atsumiense]